MLNNVNEFYKKKDLLQRLRSGCINKNMCYVASEGDYVKVWLLGDVKQSLSEDEQRDIYLTIRDTVKGKMSEIQSNVFNKIWDEMESSRKQAAKDLGVQLKKGTK